MGGNFVYVIMLGAMIASAVLFVVKKIKVNNENKNINL